MMALTVAYCVAIIPRVLQPPTASHRHLENFAALSRTFLPRWSDRGLCRSSFTHIQRHGQVCIDGGHSTSRHLPCSALQPCVPPPSPISAARVWGKVRFSALRREVRSDHSFAEEPSGRDGEWEDTLAAVAGLITKRHREQIQSDSIEAVQEYLDRLSVDIRSLPVIHVAGTKGKGSTCTMVESILRRQGLKTGLYTSPHLIDIRERIRINGDPLPRAEFTRHFWDVHRRLQDSVEGAKFQCLPGYFRYLTVMALTVFVKENVDVAVVEVGLGGRLDATNVVHPTVCGVSSLGLDHTNVLGNTIEEIAAEKAGIFKPGVLSFTSPQKPEAMQVLRRRAAEVGSQLLETPPIAAFRPPPGEPPLPEAAPVAVGIPGSMQHCNAALAVALAGAFLRSRPLPGGYKPTASREVRPEEAFLLPGAFRGGLAHARSLGRCQRVRVQPREGGGRAADGGQGGLSYYLDGAHTEESMESCVAWFGEEVRGAGGAGTGQGAGEGRRVLVFYCSPDRDPEALMAPLARLHAGVPFHDVIICSNDHPALPPGADPEQWRAELAECWQKATGMRAVVMPRVSEVIAWAEGEAATAQGRTAESIERWVVRPPSRGGLDQEAAGAPTSELHVLLTGSLLMCGDLLLQVLHRSGGVAAVDAALKFSVDQ